jgi:hypothetical protein
MAEKYLEQHIKKISKGEKFIVNGVYRIMYSNKTYDFINILHKYQSLLYPKIIDPMLNKLLHRTNASLNFSKLIFLGLNFSNLNTKTFLLTFIKNSLTQHKKASIFYRDKRFIKYYVSFVIDSYIRTGDYDIEKIFQENKYIFQDLSIPFSQVQYKFEYYIYNIVEPYLFTNNYKYIQIMIKCNQGYNLILARIIKSIIQRKYFTNLSVECLNMADPTMFWLNHVEESDLEKINIQPLFIINNIEIIRSHALVKYLLNNIKKEYLTTDNYWKLLKANRYVNCNASAEHYLMTDVDYQGFSCYTRIDLAKFHHKENGVDLYQIIRNKVEIGKDMLWFSIGTCDIEIFYDVLHSGYKFTSADLSYLLNVIYNYGSIIDFYYKIYLLEMLKDMLLNINNLDEIIKNILKNELNIVSVASLRYGLTAYLRRWGRQFEDVCSNGMYYKTFVDIITNYVKVDHYYIYLLLKKGLYLQNIELYGIQYDKPFYNLCYIAAAKANIPIYYIEKFTFVCQPQLYIQSMAIFKPLKYIKKYNLIVNGYVLHNLKYLLPLATLKKLTVNKVMPKGNIYAIQRRYEKTLITPEHLHSLEKIY